MKRIHFNIILAILFIFSVSIQAQNDKHNYTDHKPEYRKWLDSYILDKIEYTPSSTVFYFRFVCENENSGGATFYAPGGEFPWYLKGRDKKYEFEITGVKKIRRDGVLLKEDVVGEPFHADPSGPTGNTIFSCEVHFERLPDDMKVADLIEGRGQEFNRRHFNCFNIKLKTWEDDLGSEDDSKKVVQNFEEKYTGKTTVTPPTEEEKTKEEDEKYGTASRRLHSEKDLVCQELIILDHVQFHDNSTKFKGMIAANRTLYIIFNYMKEHPKSTLKLYGHSDIFGPEDRNMLLSKQRVVKIQRWLTMYGIKAHRIDYEWFGPNKPLKPEGDIINRRVEIKLDCGE